MQKVDAILRDSEFRALSEMIKKKEYDRKFCRHSLGHALSVARIALLISIEEDLHIDRELIYGAALLHDIGLTRVQLLPFHQMGERKYEFLNRTYEMAGVKALHQEDLDTYRKIFLNHGITCFF